MRTPIYGLCYFPMTTRVGEFLMLFVQFRTRRIAANVEKLPDNLLRKD